MYLGVIVTTTVSNLKNVVRISGVFKECVTSFWSCQEICN